MAVNTASTMMKGDELGASLKLRENQLALLGSESSWSPIKNINDPYVIEIARFAVAVYNKLKGEKLEFEKLIKGESHVVAGTKYRLTLSAKSGSSSNNYEAIVWDHPLVYFRNLTSFKRA
ncbi:cysteine proteinase inhibitor 1-like [Vicia villosa]|uniref:cysteine proteinase inhibitor 1-like n=1 Tax=Vicia villosa TaxID=3911 RepID=UPI00273ADEC7|nr:cysteine proteinase inhibitor 1-like [Vicia villosa]